MVTGLANPPAPCQFLAACLPGSGDFVTEAEIANELGDRAMSGSEASVSLSTLDNDCSDLRSTAVPASTRLRVNLAAVKEAELQISSKLPRRVEIVTATED